MDNPLTFAMARTSTKPIDLAKQLKLSRQYISRGEMGCHAKLGPKVTRWIINALEEDFPDGLSHHSINNWYALFQQEKRDQARLQLGGGVPINDMPPVSEIFSSEIYRPKFITWRETYWSTTYAFARDMCVHPSSVDSYESGISQTMPGDLKYLMMYLSGPVIPKQKVTNGE